MSIEDLLAYNERKDMLRLLTAGSVDDGKSTLIGRLLHDSKDIYEDHLKSLERDSKRIGSAGDDIDYALVTDGLKAEREQGITIDVAYRYFSTPKRKFIIADCPGHEQYTRNMATGASTADLAIILIDAEQGVLPQTRRHSFISSLLGIGHIVVAVNKMDLVDYSESVFERIRRDYTDFATRLEAQNIHFIPMSALKGDNVVAPSDHMPWFRGAPLLDHLETVHVASGRNFIDLRFPVQYVLRPDRSFRGYCGTVGSGVVRVGNEVAVLPSGRTSRVKAIIAGGDQVDHAFPPMAVAICLEDEIDVSRGDLLVHPRNRPRTDREFDATLVWMSETPMSRQRPYRIKHCASTASAEISELQYRFEINELRREPATTLELNEIGRVRINLSRALSFDDYQRNRTTGGFILIDPVTNGTVAAGMILRRQRAADGDETTPGADAHSPHLRARSSQVSRAERIERSGHDAAVVWFTGLPRSGKTTIAYALERRLFEAGCAANVLDGENLRLGISDDLGFGTLERSENVRRAAHVAKLCNDIGLITIVALVSPYEADRIQARAIIGEDRFHEVYLSAPVKVCESRDFEGLYERARSGQIERFTGVSAPYERPRSAELVLPTHEITVEEAVDRLVERLARAGLIRAR